MRIPKWAWVVLATATVAAGAIAYAAANLDDYLTANRASIAERISLTLGRSVRFEQLSLSLGRGLGISVRDLVVAEDPHFGPGDFLTAGNAFVQIRMIPALLGRYEIARISLEHPLISLVRTTDGINFETLSRERGSESDDASSAERRAVAVALLDIKDGTVRYLDRTTKPPREIIAEQLEFQASDLSYGDALRFELSAAAFGARIPNVKASGAVGPVEPEDVAATPLDLVAQLDEIDSSALLQVISAPAELRLDGPVSAKLEVGGMLSAWTLNFALNAESARVGVGGVADKPRGIPLMVSGHVARRDDVTFVVDSIDVAASASTLTASGTVTTGKASTAYGISLSGTGLSLADCASLLPSLRDAEPQGHADVALEITKPAAATSPAIEGRVGLDGVGFRLGESLPPVSQLSGIVSFDGRRATLGPSDLRVGGAPASIRAGVDNVFAPVVRFQFSSPGFPLAALAETQSADTIEGLDIAGRVFLTGASPRITAEMHAAGAIVSGLPMKNLTATVNHEKGSTSVEPISFDSCGGRLRGAATYSATTGSSTTPRLGLEVHAGDLIITQLGAALADSRSAPVSGTMGFDLVADAAGTDWPTIRRSLSGRGGFDLTKGAILGINIPEVTLERLSGVPGLSALLPPHLRSDFPALFGHEDTRFESLTSSFQIENGRLQTRDLALVAPDFTIGAVGGMGLDLSIDLAATLTTSPELAGRLIGEIPVTKSLVDASGRMTIPFRLVGTIPDVKPQPDVAALTSLIQRGLVESLGEQLLGGGKKKRPAQAPPTQ